MPGKDSCVRCHSTEGDLDVSGVCATCRSRPGNADTPEGSGTVFNPPPSVNPFDRTATNHLDFDPTKTIDVAVSPTLPTPPLSFTNYELHECIGEGGMGLVFRATQKGVNRVVALKVMAGAAEFDDRQRQRFRSEAESLGRTSHPGIVTIYDVGEENGRMFFSMEYCPGGSLARSVRAGAKPDAKRAGRLIAAVARAVEAAHKVGVIHRDLKPSNILLAADGTPKVADFGLAVLTDRDSRMTSSGALVGTPSYCAPEQASGKKELIGPRTDVWALGATLYDLLTGQPPFKADTAVATAVKVLNDPVVPPRKLNPAIPPDLEAVCLKCLEKDPANRYASAAALADDLDTWAADKPTQARPATAGQRAWASAKQNRALFAGVGGIIILLAAAPFLWPGPAPKTDSKSDREKAAEALLKDLEAGKEVTLIPKKGLTVMDPTWVYGEVNPVPSDIDGTFSFQTQLLSMVELLQDPLHDHYKLRGQFRHDHQLKPDGAIGFYYGFDRTTDPNGKPLHRAHFVSFIDFPDDNEENDAEAKASHRLIVRDSLVSREKGFLPAQSYHELDFIKYPLPVFDPMVERPWRDLEVEVSPTGVFVRFTNASNWLETKFSIDEIRAGTKILENALSDYFHTPTTIPAWSPRRPLGIFAERSTVSVRNVTLTPIRP